MDKVICKSGLKGWQCRLRENYEDLDEFASYARIYGLLARLGFDNAEDAWEANPVVQGSTNPDDYRVVAL